MRAHLKTNGSYQAILCSAKFNTELLATFYLRVLLMTSTILANASVDDAVKLS